MINLKQYISEGLEADIIGLLKSFGAGDIDIQEEYMSATLRKKQQVFDIIGRLPAWVDHDLIVYDTGNPSHREPDEDIEEGEIDMEDLNDDFHEYELIIYLYNTEEEVSEETIAEAMYNLGDKTVSKKEMLKAAIGKEIVFISGKIVYHAIMSDKDSDTASVFPITKKEFEKLDKKDRTSPKVKEKVASETAKKMAKKLDMRDAITYNGWVRSNKPSDEEKVEYMKKEFGLSEAIVSEESDNELLAERKRIIKVNAQGKRRIKIKCKKGYKYTNGKCVKITGSEMVNKRRAIKKAVRTKRQKGTGFQRRVQRLRKRALKKRKSMGLHSSFDRDGYQLDEAIIARREPSKGGFDKSIGSNFSGVVIYTPKNPRDSKMIEGGAKDRGMTVKKYDDKSLKITGHNHDSLIANLQKLDIGGVAQFQKNYDTVKEDVNLDEARYPKGKYGSKTKGDAKAQWMKTYQQELSNRKDAAGNAGKIDWNVATHNFFMGTDAKIAAQTVKSPWKE